MSCLILLRNPESPTMATIHSGRIGGHDLAAMGAVVVGSRNV